MEMKIKSGHFIKRLFNYHLPSAIEKFFHQDQHWITFENTIKASKMYNVLYSKPSQREGRLNGNPKDQKCVHEFNHCTSFTFNQTNA